MNDKYVEMLEHISNIVNQEMFDREYLKQYQRDIIHISDKLTRIFTLGDRLYICGNGGSSADASHIASEFIKDFSIKRKSRIDFSVSDNSHNIMEKLQTGLPAFALTIPSNITAIANDIDYSMVYAQQIFAYGNKGDILVLLSTSGNSENIINAAIVAKHIGVYTVGVTGNHFNKLESICDYTIKINYPTTARVQETYLSVFHVICAVVEKVIYEA